MLVLKRLLLVFCTVSFLTVLVACQEQQGPAEQAGQKIDDTVEKVGEEIEKAGDKVEKKTQN